MEGRIQLCGNNPNRTALIITAGNLPDITSGKGLLVSSDPAGANVVAILTPFNQSQVLSVDMIGDVATGPLWVANDWQDEAGVYATEIYLDVDPGNQ